MLLAHKFTHFPYLLAPDGDANGGGGGNNNPNTGSDLENRLVEAFNSIVQKQGGHDAAGVLLLQENRDYREKIRTLEQQVSDLKGKVPGEGAVVLDSEQANAWQAYQALGQPDELKQLKGDYTQLQRNALFQQAGEAHGYKAAVLGQLPGMDQLQLEVREVEQDGKKAKVAFVKNGEGQERPLPEYASEQWADFLPALTVEAKSQASGTPWPKQNVGSPGADQTITDQYLERKRKAQETAKNPITGE